MCHVAIPLRCEEFLYQKGSSFNVDSIPQVGLIASGKDTEEGRQTVFFTPLDPSGDDTEEEFDDFSQPRKALFQSTWKVSQAAVYWIHLAKAPEKGVQFWQTRSHAIIFYDSVPAGCIERVVCLQGDKILCPKDSQVQLQR